MPTICTAWGPPGSVTPTEWTFGDEKPPTDAIPTDKIHTVNGVQMRDELQMRRLVPIHRWESTDRTNAAMHFNVLRKHGIPRALVGMLDKEGRPLAVAVPSRVWRYRGAPHYIDQQADRLRQTRISAKRAQTNKELHHMSGLLAQLSEQITEIVKRGKFTLDDEEKKKAKAILAQCEYDVGILHMVAAAAAQAVDEASQAFGVAMPQREYQVTSVFDGLEQSNGHVSPKEPKETETAVESGNQHSRRLK